MSHWPPSRPGRPPSLFCVSSFATTFHFNAYTTRHDLHFYRFFLWNPSYPPFRPFSFTLRRQVSQQQMDITKVKTETPPGPLRWWPCHLFYHGPFAFGIWRAGCFYFFSSSIRLCLFFVSIYLTFLHDEVCLFLMNVWAVGSDLIDEYVCAGERNASCHDQDFCVLLLSSSQTCCSRIHNLHMRWTRREASRLKSKRWREIRDGNASSLLYLFLSN
ncbi:hypothetical protein M440DRAFT_213577 [Trichoderma longibrachiatum ATCC 18648]|uniref:Uncharacterized protein n=1 Tax=Trichoderma longibrachiatum ATCC 18648 TaxID=983965 RepID=A0A2T4BQ78_TRILO|nr:hypothetical protein M440DRAFT_213577 [Trichoderma longibrachiatum ATCC 18648]